MTTIRPAVERRWTVLFTMLLGLFSQQLTRLCVREPMRTAAVDLVRVWLGRHRDLPELPQLRIEWARIRDVLTAWERRVDPCGMSTPGWTDDQLGLWDVLTASEVTCCPAGICNPDECPDVPRPQPEIRDHA
jgi:hypothetical protein